MNKLRSQIVNIPTQVVVLIILFLAAYWVPLKSMVHIWWENEDYSYGFLIPLASAYLLWERRKTLEGIPVRSAWGIMPVLAFFILLSLYGILGSSGNISMPSIPILIILFAGFCFGIECVRRLILPLGFLFFMVPVPDVIERHIGMHLKAISSKLGGNIIGACNIPVHVSGNVIDLGVTQLQVVDACSGMRYIFPLLALGILYANFFERVPWKRVFCVLVTIPLGVLFNSLRIGATGILTEMFGPKVAEGFFHDLSGFVLFIFAFIMLLLIGRILAVFSPKTMAAKGSPAPQTGNAAQPAHDEQKRAGAFLLSTAALVCVAFLSLSTNSMSAVKIDGGIQGFPLLVGEWHGSNETVGQDIIKRSGAEEAFSGRFVSGSGADVFLYIGYRSTAFLANENFFHSPTACIPSSGWLEKEVKRRTIGHVPHFGNLNVTQMVIEREGVRQLLYFWFQTKDEATHDKNINRYHLSLHAIRRDNTYDLFIRPVTPINSAEGIEDAERRLDGFVRSMMPVLLDFLKEKTG